jgi:hypothetical protein
MTVRRRKTESFNANCPEVASAVRTVLSRRPPYVKLAETEEGNAFETNVKPSWWLLGTDMTIELQPIPTGTQIIAQTKSQFFIFGDVFDYYNGYLCDFFRDVRAVVQAEQSSSITASSKQNKTIQADNPFAPPEHS